ncbi:hypothetical protein ABLG96_13650 [Nakamurella sp. A5-74]|uniref:SecDF P1 head subdomain domain-containing protein n=1 Tax=Nakamurella sp. A5-74 TaxID=3158264 RepID=A0AAU8DJP4_9ACTN
MKDGCARRRNPAARATRMWGWVLVGSVLAGCSSTVAGRSVESGSSTVRPSSDTPSSGAPTGSSTQTEYDLELTIVPTEGAGATTRAPGTRTSTVPDTDFVSAVSMVLGGVEGFPASALEAQDVAVGTVDRSTRLWLKVPGATDAQIALARRAVVGAWAFQLRVVISAAVAPAGCSALEYTPKSDRVCDPQSQEVLVLGTALPVLPSSASYELQGAVPTATMTFTGAAEETIANYTAAHVGDRLAVIDGRGLITAPTIQSAITGGTIQIAGNYTPAQARSLVGKLHLAAAGVTISSGS